MIKYVMRLDDTSSGIQEFIIVSALNYLNKELYSVYSENGQNL